MKRLRMIRNIGMSAAAFAVALTCGCELTGDDDDPQIRVARVPDRETELVWIAGLRDEYLAVFGGKDRNGQPTGSAHAAVFVMSNGSWVQVSLGSNRRAQRMTFPDGYALVFRNYTETAVEVSMLDPSGAVLENVVADLPGATSTLKSQFAPRSVTGTWAEDAPDQSDLSWVASAVKCGACVGTTIGAIATHGAATQWAVATCTSFALGEVTEVTESDADDAGVLTLSTFSGVAQLIDAGNPAGLVTTLGSAGIDWFFSAERSSGTAGSQADSSGQDERQSSSDNQGSGQSAEQTENSTESEQYSPPPNSGDTGESDAPGPPGGA